MEPEKDALLRRPPVARAAYSDRTAWLMASLSRLAYEPFEPPQSRMEDILGKIAEQSDTDRIAALVDEYVEVRQRRSDEYLERLNAGLGELGFELVATFSSGGTQAFLATRDRDRLAVLAFRGTEKDWQDIKTDLNARFYEDDNGARIYTGFWKTYRKVCEPVREQANRLCEEGYRLYLTGHSLGGALAVVATRDLNQDRIAACYTFGSPKVGNEEFGYPIKPPIYRVVNAVDAVPRVPPTWITEGLYQLTRILRVPLLPRILANVRGYSHWGDMRYLTASRATDFSEVQLLPNPSWPNRLVRGLWRIVVDWQAPFKDHAIDAYCDKLKAYALRRIDVA